MDEFYQTFKEVKGIWIRKKDAKLSLSSDDGILYIGSPKNSTIKLSELISKFSKVVGYRISIHKSVIFIWKSNNKLSEKEII